MTVMMCLSVWRFLPPASPACRQACRRRAAAGEQRAGTPLGSRPPEPQPSGRRRGPSWPPEAQLVNSSSARSRRLIGVRRRPTEVTRARGHSSRRRSARLGRPSLTPIPPAARDAPRGSEARVARLFEMTSDLLATISLEGRFTLLNPAWEKLLGWTREELAGGAARGVHAPR